MGIAAYYRGNKAISDGIRRAYGFDVPEDRPQPKPTPRPPSWGSKVRAAALKRARGILGYSRRRGYDDPTVSDLAEMVRMDNHKRFTVKVAQEAAAAALEASDG